jgi:hypothetical protein
MKKKITIDFSFEEISLVLNVLQMFERQPDEVWQHAHINTKKREKWFSNAVQKIESAHENFDQEDDGK